MSTLIKFTAYQRFFNKKGEEQNIAIERNANVEDTTSLNHVFGGIFQSLFNLQSTATFTGRRVFSLSHPIFLRFEFNGEVIDTASYDTVFLNAMKLGNKYEARRKFAKNTWALTIDRKTVVEPVVYIPDQKDIVPVRLLGMPEAKVGILEEGIRTTMKTPKQGNPKLLEAATGQPVVTKVKKNKPVKATK